MSNPAQKENKNYTRLFAIAGIVLSLDQLTKFLVQKYIVFESSYFEPDRITIFENFLYCSWLVETPNNKFRGKKIAKFPRYTFVSEEFREILRDNLM